jgi:hypothetical protein
MNNPKHLTLCIHKINNLLLLFFKILNWCVFWGTVWTLVSVRHSDSFTFWGTVWTLVSVSRSDSFTFSSCLQYPCIHSATVQSSKLSAHYCSNMLQLTLTFWFFSCRTKPDAANTAWYHHLFYSPIMLLFLSTVFVDGRSNTITAPYQFH